jgi:phosphinothricin acetyltransferase
VHSDYAGKRVGSVLYEALHEILIKQNIINLYAGIAQPNEPSTMFHIRMGFTPVGVYKKVGFKNGQWHDVVWVHKTLVKHVTQPSTPIKFSDPALAPIVQQVLEAKTAELNNKQAV